MPYTQEKENLSIEIFSEGSKMLDLVEKDFKTGIINMLKTKELKKIQLHDS